MRPARPIQPGTPFRSNGKPVFQLRCSDEMTGFQLLPQSHPKPDIQANLQGCLTAFSTSSALFVLYMFLQPMSSTG
jgi:hypothetical protein